MRYSNNKFHWPWYLLLLATAMVAGCDSAAYFHANVVEMQLKGITDNAIASTYNAEASDPEKESQRVDEEMVIATENRQAIADMLLALFGTPDNPNPFEESSDGEGAAAKDGPLESLGFDLDKLKVAAGPVYSDSDGVQHGLYRLHCGHCHGVTGGGDGPTARFLNPYPRDYRPGVFKFKSTYFDAKPTRQDLKRTLMEGIPGSSMPSFRLLPDNELEALIEYVKYLSVRGETEIRMIKEAADEGEVPDITVVAGGFPLARDEDGIPEEEPEYENIIASIIYKWDVAPRSIIYPVAPKVDRTDETPEGKKALAASIERGRKLFYSETLKCVSCHGDAALGDGENTDYNHWFQWRKALSQQPPEVIHERVSEMLSVGALPPRNAMPRNLRLGVFRGGRRPIDIYRRIFGGIYGSPMPAQGKDTGIAGDKVTEEEAGGAVPRQALWDVVNYVLSLQYEPLSQGPAEVQGSDYTLR